MKGGENDSKQYVRITEEIAEKQKLNNETAESGILSRLIKNSSIILYNVGSSNITDTIQPGQSMETVV